MYIICAVEFSAPRSTLESEDLCINPLTYRLLESRGNVQFPIRNYTDIDITILKCVKNIFYWETVPLNSGAKLPVFWNNVCVHCV